MTEITEKPTKELDDLAAMNRIAAIMKKLPESDRARVAAWVAQRWSK